MPSFDLGVIGFIQVMRELMNYDVCREIFSQDNLFATLRIEPIIAPQLSIPDLWCGSPKLVGQERH